MKFRPVAIVLLALLVAACGSADKKRDKTLEELERLDGVIGRDSNDPLKERRRQQRLAELDAQQLYLRARSYLDRSDYRSALEAYDDLARRYPFSDYATQGEIESLYATYRLFEYERAISAADRFLREHPRHPAIDYVYYLRGLTQFDREGSALAILPVDETRSDVSSQRRAFDDFALLLQRFPDSRYAGDARQRMVHIRNRVAAHELHVVDFYMRRGAYVAAAKRAEQIIAQYPGTLASYRALLMMAESFQESGLDSQAAETRRLIEGQDPVVVAAAQRASISELGAIDVRHPDGPRSTRKQGWFSGWFSDEDEALASIEPPPAKPASDVPVPADAESASETELGSVDPDGDDVATKARKAEKAAREADAPASAGPPSDAPEGSLLKIVIDEDEGGASEAADAPQE